MRITKRMLEQVDKKLAERYRYWRKEVSEDYRKYGGVGEDTWEEYKKVRAEVIKLVKS